MDQGHPKSHAPGRIFVPILRQGCAVSQPAGQGWVGELGFQKFWVAGCLTAPVPSCTFFRGGDPAPEPSISQGYLSPLTRQARSQQLYRVQQRSPNPEDSLGVTFTNQGKG